MPDPFVYVAEAALATAVAEDRVELAAADLHHLGTVVRAAPGSGLEISDGAGRVAPAVIEGDGARLTAAPVRITAPTVGLHVLQALGKGRKHDEVVRVLTEAGVDAVTAIAAERSITRLDPRKADKARERWIAVARAAGAQSRRPWLPRIAGPLTIAEVGAVGSVGSVGGVVAHVGASTALADGLARLLEAAPGDARGLTTSEITTSEITIAVGPEGGWGEREITSLTDRGLTAVTLGPGVLRTEHAALVVAAVAGFLLGRMVPARSSEPTAASGPFGPYGGDS